MQGYPPRFGLLRLSQEMAPEWILRSRIHTTSPTRGASIFTPCELRLYSALMLLDWPVNSYKFFESYPLREWGGSIRNNLPPT